MTGLNQTFTVNEKRAYRIDEIQIISDGRTRKQYTLTAKWDGVNPSYYKTYEDFYASVKNDDLDGVNFTRSSVIEVDLSQFPGIAGESDIIDLYIRIEYIGDIFDEVFDEATGSLKITYTAEADNVVYTDDTVYGAGTAWAGTPPAEIQQAVTRLANAVAGLLGGQIPE